MTTRAPGTSCFIAFYRFSRHSEGVRQNQVQMIREAWRIWQQLDPHEKELFVEPLVPCVRRFRCSRHEVLDAINDN